MINLEWPWVLLLAPVPFLLAFAGAHRKTRNADRAIIVTPRLGGAMQQLQTRPGTKSHLADSRILRLSLLWIAWLALLVAIAQPVRPEQSTAQAASGRALSLLVDLSTSMERRDFEIDSQQVDRLTVVKSIAERFIKNRSGDRISLVLFGSEAFIGSALSYDLDSVNYVLQSSGIGMAGRTTAMGDALGLAIKTLQDDPSQEKAIVLLSDGTNNAGSAEPEDAARLAATLGIRIHTIGLGSDASTGDQQQFQSASADLDEAALKAIATESGGKFFRAHTTAELQLIYSEIDALESSDHDAPPLIITQDLRNRFILVALLSILLTLLLNGLSRRRQ